jgi:hypothetical protein
VADTFHVKPLLKWIQLDREFLLLGFESGSVTLYQGDLQTLRPVDTVLFSPGVESSCSGSSLGGLNEWRDRKMRIQSTLEWLNGWILSLTLEVRPRLFLAGPQELTRKCLQIFQYENLASHAVSDTYSQQELSKLGTKVRVQLRAEARKSYRRRLAEFSDALSVRQASGNIFAIAQAAALGNVRKLLVADGIQLFGKLNRSSGSLQLHGGDLDHEDDDVLDDLAQLVLNRGGEVTVAARAEIPSGSAIQAILDEPDRHGYATVRARPGLTHVRFERSAS